MPVAKLWCVDITGSPSTVIRRIFHIAFDPKQTFEQLIAATREQLKHKVKASDDVTLDIWKLDPSIARTDTRLNEGTKTTYTDLLEHVTTLSPSSGVLGDVFDDLPEEESLHLLVSIKGNQRGEYVSRRALLAGATNTRSVAEGTIHLLTSELTDIKFAEARQRHLEWLASLGSSEFENREDVIAKRKRGEDPFREIPLAILCEAFDRFLWEWHYHGQDGAEELDGELYTLAIKFSGACWKAQDPQSQTSAQEDDLVPLLSRLLLPSFPNLTFTKRTSEGAAFNAIYRINDVFPALIVLRNSSGDVQAAAEKVYSKSIGLASLDPWHSAAPLPTFILVLSPATLSPQSQTPAPAPTRISVYAAANPSLVAVSEPLIPFLVTTSMPSDPGRVFEDLGRLFGALRAGVGVLNEYYARLQTSGADRKAPRYLPSRDTVGSHRIRYENLLVLGKKIWRAWISREPEQGTEGEGDGEQRVLVKFTRSYCTPAHRLLEREGLAVGLVYADADSYNPPRDDDNDAGASTPTPTPTPTSVPRHEKDLEGQTGKRFWRMVITEFMEPSVPLTSLLSTTSVVPAPPPEASLHIPATLTQKAEVAKRLTRAVDVLHGAGYVFGDLRGGNVLVQLPPFVPQASLKTAAQLLEQEVKVALVDFDWAGREGVARYPVGIRMDLDFNPTTNTNPDNSTGKERGGIPWPPGVRPKGLIRKQHDLYWLGILINGLGN